MGQGDGKVIKVIKATTIDNPKYQKFEDWGTFFKAKHVEHSYNDKPSSIAYYKNGKVYCEWWCFNGWEHRDNGKPSCIGYSEDGKTKYEIWALDNMKYSRREYEQILEQVAAMNDTEKLLDPRWWVKQQVK